MGYGKFWFQFLIGRLITDLEAQHLEFIIKFQFLIGRLITVKGREAYEQLQGFQFLIGRLITTLSRHQQLLLLRVSIPHR